VFAVVVLAAMMATAQQPLPSERAFFAPVVVSVVNVEVLVTDSKGRPVPGLTADDFEVLEDGELVAISNFYAAPGVVPEWMDVEPPATPEAEADQDLYFVVCLIDNHLEPRSRQRMIDAVSDFLPRLPRHTFVMLARFTGTLHVQQPFTNDLDRLRAGLVELRKSGSTSLRSDRRRIRREMQILAGQTSREGSALPTDRSLRPLELSDYGSSAAVGYIQHIRNYAGAAANQTDLIIASLERFLRSISGLRGRKAVLLMSDGLKVNPGTDLFHSWAQIFSDVANATNIDPNFEAQRFDLSARLADLVIGANSQKITLHSLSSERERVTSTLGADQEGGVTLIAGFDTDRQIDTGRADVYLAQMTGGRTMVGNRKLNEQLARLAVDLGGYYSLGYRPTHRGDGRYHHIKVRVKGEDKFSLRHRDGYRDIGDSEFLADRTLTAAVLGLTENPLLISAECQEQQLREDGLYLVPLVIRVPLAQLSLLPQAMDHQGKISITVAVRDQQGKLAETQRRQYPLKIPHDQILPALQENAEFIMGLVMREGPQRIAVGVRDELGNVDSTFILEVEVGNLSL
jgi:VWFA-related protein